MIHMYIVKICTFVAPWEASEWSEDVCPLLYTMIISISSWWLVNIDIRETHEKTKQIETERCFKPRKWVQAGNVNKR